MKRNIIEELFKIQNKIEKKGNELIFKKFGISLSNYRLFKIIYNGKNEISEIKKISNETGASLTQKIQKLEKIGFLKRVAHKTDKRKWLFFISKDGEQFEKKISKEINIMTNNILKGISEKEIKNIFLFFEKLENNIN